MSGNADLEACREHWCALRDKIGKFDLLDDVELVFGARTHGGHQYRILPTVTDDEILAFEKNNGFELPYQYRTYLQAFGAGGAGPDYGIVDFRQSVMPRVFSKAFPYTDEVWYDEAENNDPVWELPGLAPIAQRGCGVDYLLELNGEVPGTVWCDWQEACSPMGDFLEFYKSWADKVETGLERYHLLKSFIDEKTMRLKPAGLTLEDVAEKLHCDFNVRGKEWSSSVGDGERWVYFNQTPGRVIIDDDGKVMQIDVFRSRSIL